MDETNPHSLYSIPQSHNPLMPESVVLCLECLNQPDLGKRKVETNKPIILSPMRLCCPTLCFV
jgi:hypothetical protein